MIDLQKGEFTIENTEFIEINSEYNKTFSVFSASSVVKNDFL